MINVAEGKKEEVRKAEGQAQQKIQAAEGYAEQRVNEAEGDVSRFNAVFDEYLKAPQVTKQRLYLETMKEVLPQLGRKIILDQELSRVLPLLQLETGLDGGRSR
jgi:membrane protease subunit HflK